MGVSRSSPEKGISVVTVDFPPVNALPVRGWSELAAAVRASGRAADVRCVVLAAEGRGFNAGVDIKEIQAAGQEALIGANHGCAEAFAAVYECAVPVVAAVQGFCLGGGIGLVGNADAIVASEDAVFGLPELDRGALGAATHLARLVPQHLMRALYYTGRTASADELHRHGSVWRVVPRPELRDAALGLAREIAAKDGQLLRMAKTAINGIDPVDVRRSYRFEQGFTFEANLSGLADRVRDTFGTGERGGGGGRGRAAGRSDTAGIGDTADEGGAVGGSGGAAEDRAAAGNGATSAKSDTSGKEGA
ncbi:enoyl-CoA hydratase family protein [Streptomyces monashensis]|uniref:enoyl-CoA hydratase family protein n=1 Tax=Streptomyces monashensis TaxID=1678012 RepID=UPI0009A106C6|nr:enoyl-CoA hydratase family protein [Streptomyces monashensis]